MILDLGDIMAVAIATVCVAIITYWLYMKYKTKDGFHDKYKVAGGHEMAVPIHAQQINEWW